LLGVWLVPLPSDSTLKLPVTFALKLNLLVCAESMDENRNNRTTLAPTVLIISISEFLPDSLRPVFPGWPGKAAALLRSPP
jgi:hypothetical protein